MLPSTHTASVLLEKLCSHLICLLHFQPQHSMNTYHRRFGRELHVIRSKMLQLQLSGGRFALALPSERMLHWWRWPQEANLANPWYSVFPRWVRSAPKKLLLRRPLVNRNAYLAMAPRHEEPLDPSPQADPGCSGIVGRSRGMILPRLRPSTVRPYRATAIGGPRKRSIRRRIAANNARGTATSASWKIM